MFSVEVVTISTPVPLEQPREDEDLVPESCPVTSFKPAIVLNSPIRENREELSVCEEPATVRRSGRQRKQVEFLRIENFSKEKKKKSVVKTVDEGSCSSNGSKKKRGRKASLKSPEKADDVVKETNGARKKKIKKEKGSLALNGVKKKRPDKEEIVFAENGRLNGTSEKKNRKKHAKKGKKGKKWTPWCHSSSESDESPHLGRTTGNLMEEEEEEEEHEDDSLLTDVSKDWLQEVESDFDPNAEEDVEKGLAKGRNKQRQKQRNSFVAVAALSEEEMPCQICLRTSDPEWLLLCDQCDLGHHAMCLRPSLPDIPEGDWFCPRCLHVRLLTRLEERLASLQADWKRHDSKARMQERLKFVNVSVNNILEKEGKRRAAAKRPSRKSDEDEDDWESENSWEQTEEQQQTFIRDSSSGKSDEDDDDNEFGRRRLRKRPAPFKSKSFLVNSAYSIIYASFLTKCSYCRVN